MSAFAYNKLAKIVRNLNEDSEKPGLVLVSTGVRKLRKPFVAGHYVKSSN